MAARHFEEPFEQIGATDADHLLRERIMSIRKRRKGRSASPPLDPVAGNGLLDRRALLGRGIVLAGAVTTGVGTSLTGAAAEPLTNGPSTLAPGVPIPPYGQPSKFEQKVVRTLSSPKLEPRGSAARTPHHLLNGTITPNGLHFVIARGGESRSRPGEASPPDPWAGEAADGLHARCAASLSDGVAHFFSWNGGNSAPLLLKEPIQANVQALHGLCSCAEWTGVLLTTLLEEVGVDPKAKWFIAEGADLPTMNRSIPLAKAMDDAMIALIQNGGAPQSANGYPMRLLLPGYEGNMNVKWLRRIKLVESPVMAINETKQYTILRPDGKAWQFYFPQEVKSFITHPSPGLNMKGPGFYEISGISFSGNGRISKVDVSADGGKSWAQAALQGPVLSKAFTRFRMPWSWDGRPVILQSRATDEAGNLHRRERHSLPSAARRVRRMLPRLPWSIATPSRAGASMRRARCAMSMHDRFACVLVLALGLGTANAADAPRFGEPIAPADLAPWDMSIGPDGGGLPPGSGTPAQGATVYAERGCALCHGEKAGGGPSGPLVGGGPLNSTDRDPAKLIGNYWPYATTIFDYTRGRCLGSSRRPSPIAKCTH
jgi:sulfane dehydrogenase subunit SoxC